MHLLRTRTLFVTMALCVLCPHGGHSQVLSAAAAVGPVFLPQSGTTADLQASLALGVEKGAVGGRLEGMYTGVPGADLVAFTGNLVWIFRRDRPAVEPYLIAGVGAYVKFSESRFGLNGGIGVRHQAGPLRLFTEVRYHRVTRRFDEASAAATFIPVSLGVALGH